MLFSGELPDMVNGEEVLTNTPPSWVNWARPLLAAALAPLAGIMIGSLLVTGLTLILSAIIVAVVYLDRERTQYIVTDQRVLKVKSLFKTKTVEVANEHIRAVQTRSGPWRTIGVGDVLIESHADPTRIHLTAASNAGNLADLIRNQYRGDRSTV